jgi:hypothetical protein
MRILSFEIRNFKGRTRVGKLAPSTVLIGNPFAGKSAVLDAIKVTLLGYLPKLGKRPANTFKLATGPSMTTALSFEGADSVCRTWKSVKGAIKETCAGTPPEVSPILFDLHDYLNLAAKDRLAYIAGKVTVDDDGFDPLAVLKELREIKWVSEDTAEALAAVDALLRKWDASRVEEGRSVQEFFAAAGVECKEQGTIAKQAVEQMKGIVAGSAQLRAGASPARNVEAELAKARAALRDAENAFANHRTAAEARARWERDLATIEQGLAEETSVDAGPLQRAADTAKAAFEKLELLDLHRLAGWQSDAANEVWRIQTKLEQIKLVRDGLVRQHETDLTAKFCPYCKSSAKGWTKHLVEAFDARITELSREQTELTEPLAAAVAKRDKAIGASQAAVQADKNWHRMRQAYDTARAAYDATRAKAEDLAAQRARLATLRAAPPAEVKGSPSDTEVVRCRAAVAELDLEQRRYIGERSKEAQSARAAVELRKCEARAEVFGKADRALFAMHEAAVNGAVSALIGTARRFTDGLMMGKLEFLDGEIGYMESGTWVSHEVFSGTETALAYAGFSVALNQGMPLRIVLMDELWCAGDMAPAVVKRMSELVAAGVIDQFVGAAPTPSMAGAFRKAGATVLEVE